MTIANPVYADSTEYHGTADGSNMQLATPLADDWAYDDFLLFVAGTGTSNGAWTVPAGFTALTPGNEQGNMNSRVFWRVVDGSEAASYTSQLGYTYRRAGVFARYRRALQAQLGSPIRDQSVAKTATGATGTTCPAPGSLAGTTSEDLVIRVFMCSATSASGTQTLSSSALSSAGWDVRQSIINEGSTDESCGIVLCDKLGATDSTVPTTNKSSNWIVYSLSLKGADWGTFIFPQGY
jgi:hypothetical protein